MARNDRRAEITRADPPARAAAVSVAIPSPGFPTEDEERTIDHAKTG